MFGTFWRQFAHEKHSSLIPFRRRVATCKPGKPGITSSSVTLALFLIQYLSFRKIKIQDRQNGPSKSFWYVIFLRPW